MNDNRLFVRDLVGVVFAMVLVTALCLWLVPTSNTPFVDTPAPAMQQLAR